MVARRRQQLRGHELAALVAWGIGHGRRREEDRRIFRRRPRPCGAEILEWRQGEARWPGRRVPNSSGPEGRRDDHRGHAGDPRSIPWEWLVLLHVAQPHREHGRLVRSAPAALRRAAGSANFRAPVRRQQDRRRALGEVVVGRRCRGDYRFGRTCRRYAHDEVEGWRGVAVWLRRREAVHQLRARPPRVHYCGGAGPTGRLPRQHHRVLHLDR
mmetsp:Transcript_2393/g.6860  ORF Transcript_2393/g.6860 Transcript_2393/m.6860 type:complete len:213 (+) Transcript_2393:1137-1775(+)